MGCRGGPWEAPWYAVKGMPQVVPWYVAEKDNNVHVDSRRGPVLFAFFNRVVVSYVFSLRLFQEASHRDGGG